MPGYEIEKRENTVAQDIRKFFLSQPKAHGQSR